MVANYDYQTAVETLVKIETEFDVNSLTWRNINVWPLIRLLLFSQLLHELEPINKDNIPNYRPISYLEQFKYLLKLPLRINKVVSDFIYLTKTKKTYQDEILKNITSTVEEKQNIDFLFVSFPEYHADKFKGKAYDRFVDPFIDEFKNKYSCLKLEIVTGNLDNPIPRYEETISISPNSYFNYKQCKNTLILIYDKYSLYNVKNLSRLAEYLFDQNIDVNLSQKKIIDLFCYLEKCHFL